ncbi:MAG TPA: hypothetical protein PLA97_18720 [Rubrivivax sp.]|nr:hypothetical protein [Rubrivivax sp.]
MARACRLTLVGLSVLYAVALALFLVGAYGWFGSPQGPLAGVFLIPPSLCR